MCVCVFVFVCVHDLSILVQSSVLLTYSCPCRCPSLFPCSLLHVVFVCIFHIVGVLVVRVVWMVVSTRCVLRRGGRHRFVSHNLSFRAEIFILVLVSVCSLVLPCVNGMIIHEF